MHTPDPLHQHLQALAQPPPPEALWPRLLQRRRAQVRRRRVLAGAASTGLALLLGVMAWPDPAPAPHATLKASATITHAPADIDDSVRALDRALQAAYDRGASDAEIAPMWEARDALVARSLPRPQPGGPAGI